MADTHSAAPSPRVADLFRAAITFALCFGALEGLEAALLRPVPQIQAAGKVSLDILWVSPVSHLVVNLSIAVVCAAAYRLGLRLAPRLAVMAFAFFGSLGVILYSAAIGPIASVILAAGVAVQAGRFAPRIFQWRRLWRLVATLAFLIAGAAAVIRGQAIARTTASNDRATARNGRPNVIMLVLDTVGTEYLSTYGYSEPTTPTLDRLASEGTLFAQAYSASSWTLPAHASFLTGLLPSQNGVRRWDRLASSQLQVQEVLHDAGYATGAFIGNTVNVLPEWGFDEGFDTFDVYDWRTLFARTTLGRSLRRELRRLNVDMDSTPPASVISGRFLRWLDGVGDRPFFALVNYMDAHDPYGPPGRRPDLRILDWYRHAPSATVSVELKQAYLACLRDLDRDLSSLIEMLARKPWWDDTLLIVLADHGEDIDAGRFDHGFDLRMDQIHVPLILRFPGRIAAGARIEAAVSTMAVAATIEALTGTGQPRQLPGRSLLEPPDAPAVISELEIPTTTTGFLSSVSGDYHYIRNTESGVERLYQFRADPGEQRDLARDPASQSVLDRLRQTVSVRLPSVAVR